MTSKFAVGFAGKVGLEMVMTRQEEKAWALKIRLESGQYTINEVRGKLGEPKVEEPEADRLLILTEKAGWVHLGDNTPVKVRIEPLLPKAFARLPLRKRRRKRG